MYKSIALIACTLFLSQAVESAALAQHPTVRIVAHNYSESQIESIIVRSAHKAEVPPHLLLAICWIESSYKQPKVPEPLDGNTPSYGICQVKLETAQFMDKFYRHRIAATVERLRDPYVNSFYAAKYLKFQLKQYDNDWRKAVAAYNQGTYYDDAPNVSYVSQVETAIQTRGLASE